MKLVIIESPYAGEVERNVAYARACVRDALRRGESPIASHLLYTQDGILNDDDLGERKAGIDAGHAWMKVCDIVAVYRDHGVSAGMRAGIRIANRLKVPVEFRYLPNWQVEP